MTTENHVNRSNVNLSMRKIAGKRGGVNSNRGGGNTVKKRERKKSS